MIRIVADTSTLISAVGWEGKPQEIMNKCLDKKLKLFSSPEILGEIREVLFRKKFDSIDLIKRMNLFCFYSN